MGILVAATATVPAEADASAGRQRTPAPAVTGTFSWAGQSWTARTCTGCGPGPSERWSASNVSVDLLGRLHLAIVANGSTGPVQAEVDSVRNGWGYGTYRWTVGSSVNLLAAGVVLGLFTYGTQPAYGYREIDAEASNWGSGPVTWGYTAWGTGNQDTAGRVPAPAGSSTQQFTWSPGKVIWVSYGPDGKVIGRATATGANVPVPGDEKVRMNFWVTSAATSWKNTSSTAVVINSFSFIPLSVSPGPL